MLDQAAQYGVKVMFTLTNNWKTFDSKYNVRTAQAHSQQQTLGVLQAPDFCEPDFCDFVPLVTSRASV